ncbi:MAG: maleylpyruvate isomerase family mycothiol-dependent enzyme [bacterium]|nr:maleylpyruvate isomerase family mycothiol-dependent enzyme [bacterium]
MEKAALFDAVTAQRHRLIGVLDDLSDKQWNARSLCEKWRVRDVVGHLVTILDIPAGRFLWRSFRARSYDGYAADVACEYGSQDPGQLLAKYRQQLAGKRIAPPIVGPIAPLTDVLIHTRDIERPLGISATLHPEGLRAALDYCCGGRAIGFVPGKRTKGLRFEASDMDWSVGDGALVSGPAEAILLAVTNRPIALSELSGDGAEMLGNRLG